MTARNSGILYPAEFNALLGHRGHTVHSRWGETLEASVVSNVLRPAEIVPFAYGRQANHFGMLAEALWVLSDVEEVRLLRTFNDRLSEFSDDGITLYGAYGPRLNRHPDQVREAIRILREDADSRQVVLSIWRPGDLGRKTKDLPCNDMVMFKIRDGKLNMTVMNRSNDIHWGLFGVNMPQFSLLQNHVANMVGVDVGVQSHVSDSLHLYLESDPHRFITDRMLRFSGSAYLDFYSYFPVDDGPIDVCGLHDPRYVIRNLFQDLHELGEYTGDNYQMTPFMATAYELLQTYALVKNKTLGRADAIRNLKTYLLRSLVPTGYQPLDWVFAGYYTLVHQTPPRYRNAIAEIALREFLDYAKEVDVRATSVPIEVQENLLRFLREG